jgi:hypothetical protein
MTGGWISDCASTAAAQNKVSDLMSAGVNSQVKRVSEKLRVFLHIGSALVFKVYEIPDMIM